MTRSWYACELRGMNNDPTQICQDGALYTSIYNRLRTKDEGSGRHMSFKSRLAFTISGRT